MKHAWKSLAVLFGLSLLTPSAVTAEESPRPNIIVIMLDDMGWSDLGCYGGEVQTPNIDRLAAGGLRFSNFYNTSRCCPTRAALLTGLYPHQAGVGQMTFDRNQPGYRGQLSRNAVTVAEVLRPAGYRTAMVGKWHLSLTGTMPGGEQLKWLNHQAHPQRPFSDPATYPVGRGFEEHYGVIWGVVDYFDPFSLVHNTTPVASVPKDYYATDAFTDHAIEYVQKYSQDGDPFFLYLAYTAPHWPLHALPEDIEKYADTYKVGWDAIRRARYRRMVEMGLIDADEAVLSTRHEKERRWEDEPHQAWEARTMAVHAAMIDRVDQGVGRLVTKLRQLSLLDDTLIFVLADNGASPERPRSPGFDRNGQTRDGRQVHYYGPGKNKDILPGEQTTYAGIGPMWANAANTPFRYWKKEQFEGGVCTPLIVHWPKGVTVDGGSITHQPGHVIDLMATCVDLAGADYPRQFNGHEITPREGKSLAPIFRGQTRPGHEAIYFEHYGARGIRRGDWKLAALAGKRWELHNLAQDRTETNDLAGKHPEKVAELSALWEAWARRASVFPLPGRGK